MSRNIFPCNDHEDKPYLDNSRIIQRISYHPWKKEIIVMTHETEGVSKSKRRLDQIIIATLRILETARMILVLL